MIKEENPIRILKNTWFVRFVKREKISDAALKKVIGEAERGIIDADLGGGVIKQRIARTGQGKSGGYRTIIAFKKGNKAFFMYGFVKSELENLQKDELKDYKKAAKIYLNMSDEEIEKLVEMGELTEIKS